MCQKGPQKRLQGSIFLSNRTYFAKLNKLEMLPTFKYVHSNMSSRINVTLVESVVLFTAKLTTIQCMVVIQIGPHTELSMESHSSLWEYRGTSQLGSD